MCCKKKKVLMTDMAASRRKLSSENLPPQPPTKWSIWQCYFAMRCFDDRVMQTKTINRVISPYTLAAQMIALQKASAGMTTKFFQELLRVESFYNILDFERDLKSKLSIIPLERAESNDRSLISTFDRIYLDEKVKIDKVWKAFVDTHLESLKLITFNVKSEDVQTGQYFINELRNVCGSVFTASNPATLCSVETKVLSVVGVRIRALLAAETYVYRKCPFLLSYGNQQQEHPFFVAKGEFQHLIFDDFEAWQIPLRPKSLSSESALSGDKARSELKLILLRPNCVGDLLAIERVETFDEVAKAINKLRQIEPEKANLLLPYMDLPSRSDEPTYGITDLAFNWRENYPDCINQLKSLSCDSPKKTSKNTCLDRLYHCASLTLSPNGLSFQSKADPVDESDAVSYVPSKEKCNAKGSKEKVSRSMILQKLRDNNVPLPPKIKIVKTTKLCSFAARFDSPFLFLIVETNTGSILMSGSYGGKPAMPKNAMTKDLTLKQQSPQKKQKKKSKCCIC